MNLRSFFFIFIIIAALISGCQKKDATGNPCDGLLNESPPTKIMVQFLDKLTGQNLILSKNLKADDVTVIDPGTGKPFAGWVVSSGMSSSPFNGSVQFSVFHETAGNYSYQITLADLGTVTMTYTVSKTVTGDPCKPNAYPVSDIKISDHAYLPFSYDGKSYPNILVVEL